MGFLTWWQTQSFVAALVIVLGSSLLALICSIPKLEQEAREREADERRRKEAGVPPEEWPRAKARLADIDAAEQVRKKAEFEARCEKRLADIAAQHTKTERDILHYRKVRAEAVKKLSEDLDLTEREPEPKPVEPEDVDPGIERLEALAKQAGRYDHAEEIKKKLQEKYGANPPEYIQALMEDIDEDLLRYRAERSRAPQTPWQGRR